MHPPHISTSFLDMSLVRHFIMQQSWRDFEGLQPTTETMKSTTLHYTALQQLVIAATLRMKLAIRSRASGEQLPSARL